MPKAEHQRGRSMALYETILKLKDLDECCRFFDDLCTPTELRSLEQRFDVAVYLQQGLVYLDILEKTGASSATISRVRRAMLDNGGAVGRKLDFLLQEMNREANTIGSKCTDVAVARIVVDIKAELEKIREQVQNVE